MIAWKDSKHRWHTLAETEGQASRILQVALSARDLIPVGREVAVHHNGSNYQTVEVYRPHSFTVKGGFAAGDLILIKEPGRTIVNSSLVGMTMIIHEVNYSPEYWNGSPGQPRLTEVRFQIGSGREFLEHGTYVHAEESW